jgi:hypothetical protein
MRTTISCTAAISGSGQGPDGWVTLYRLESATTTPCTAAEHDVLDDFLSGRGIMARGGCGADPRAAQPLRARGVGDAYEGPNLPPTRSNRRSNRVRFVYGILIW